MADVNRGNRPLSPFMIGPYYRPQITSISSIMVRITGIACFGFAFLIVCWLLAAASSEAAFSWVNWLLTSWIGDLLMLLAAWCIWYHVLGRIRHVIWDFGYNLDVETSRIMALIMFGGATVLALFTVLVV